MNTHNCLFCQFKDQEVREHLDQNEFAYALLDKNPVSPGHALVIPKRHVQSMFDLTENEILAIHDLLNSVKNTLEPEYHPDGYNLGLNDGAAAGRTVHHCHFHLIPRYQGDVENPRGGVRHIIPGKGDY